MTNTAGGETATVGPKGVLERYVAFYSRVWSEGSVKVCEDTQLMDQARQMVLTHCEVAHTFTLLPFYPTVLNIINTCTSSTTSTSVLQRLIKAFGVLELLCVNFFLFPWKKEIKILKKFTGHFVYHINPVLPQQTTRSILHHIGYTSQTDTEYNLSDGADPTQATEMGFELFLARIECEHLIQMTSQVSQADCLQIIQNRSSAVTLKEDSELQNSPNSVLETDGRKDDGLLNPDPSVKPLDLKMCEHQNSEQGTFLTEDTSILEMQKDYPDLTFRLRPIFKSSSVKVKRSRERNEKFGREVRGPRSVTLHTETQEPALGPHSSEEQHLHVVGLKHSDEVSVMDLAERMDKLKLKELHGEEPLKWPVEETVQCENNETVPNLCSPSSHHLCTITACSNCAASDRLQQHHGITEPPQSFYIPNHVSASAPAPTAEHEENSYPTQQSQS